MKLRVVVLGGGFGGLTLDYPFCIINLSEFLI